MELSRVNLFNSREWLYFIGVSTVIFIYSLLIEYQNYSSFTQYRDTITQADVLLEYKKKKKSREYYVYKMRLEGGEIFYTTAPLGRFQNLQGKRVKIWLLVNKLSFFDYLQTFYLPSKILKVETAQNSFKKYIKTQHQNEKMQELYGALFFASSISKDLRQSVANFGVSHLIAISGFHLGVLSFLLFFLLKKPLQTFYNISMPYRHSERDLFGIIALLLFVYMSYLHFPASLLRAFMMFVIGYILYDRGIKVISMQTLFVSIVLLVAFFPRLLFSLGFFLSISGVYFLFLYLQIFPRVKNRFLELLFISIWMYFMMLPLGVSIFHIFSLYHPLSIILSMLFTLFYPLVLLLHTLGFGDLFDKILLKSLEVSEGVRVTLSSYTFYLYILVALLSSRFAYVRYILIFFSVALFLLIEGRVLYS